MTTGTSPWYSAPPGGDVPPSTETLLATGGDTRIVLDPNTGLNRYGCRMVPDAGLLALGSSTASVISAAGFAAADNLRRRIAASAATQSPAAVYARELSRMRRELIALCGLEDLCGLECVFGASGTDIHMVVAQLVADSRGRPLRIVVADALETGSGVPAALAGRHFSARSAFGKAVAIDQPLDDGMPADVATVALRNNDGSPRAVAEVDAEFTALARKATAAGQRVLLVMTDVSKTGMIAPSAACVVALHRELADGIDVLVDACQFRLAPASLRGYVERGFMVALTGSKFVGGPSFSGALLIPARSARRYRWRPLPGALAAYSACAEWPSNWASAGTLANAANFGLLLRWQAALEELRRFRAVPEREIACFLQAFANAAWRRLANHPLVELLATPTLERWPMGAAGSWDRIPTIFPFVLYRATAEGRRPLHIDETHALYQVLQTGDCGWRYQLGQPVACGQRDGVPIVALRLCASARMVVEAVREEGNAAAVIDRSLSVLKRAEAIVTALPGKG